MTRTFLLAGLTALALAGAAEAEAGISTTPPSPVRGMPVTITVTAADDLAASGATVTALYRPGSEVSREEPVGTTGLEGTVTWTPSGSGVVALTAQVPGEDAQSRNLSVRFPAPPTSGILILVVAGLILYGGVYRGFRSLGVPPTGLRPDT